MKKSAVKRATSLILAIALMVPLCQTAFAADGPDQDIVRTEEPAPAKTATAKGFVTSETYKYSSLKKKIAKYQETNKDVKGWLVVPGTNINEPIVYNKKGNNYYVARDWTGKYYPNVTYKNFPVTATYADYRTAWGQTWRGTSRNTVLYGHNWTNLRTPVAVGTDNSHVMFGQLPSYTDINFAKENPYIYYSTGENEGIWKVFAVAYCELKPSFFYNNPNPGRDNGVYQKLLDEWKARSMFDFDVDLNLDDRILTLSTCTRQYQMGENQRFVVVARLLREGESETDKVKVSVNKDMKAPQF